jgi:hypothetical protein
MQLNTASCRLSSNGCLIDKVRILSVRVDPPNPVKVMESPTQVGVALANGYIVGITLAMEKEIARCMGCSYLSFRGQIVAREGVW